MSQNVARSLEHVAIAATKLTAFRLLSPTLDFLTRLETDIVLLYDVLRLDTPAKTAMRTSVLNALKRSQWDCTLNWIHQASVLHHRVVFNSGRDASYAPKMDALNVHLRH